MAAALFLLSGCFLFHEPAEDAPARGGDAGEDGPIDGERLPDAGDPPDPAPDGGPAVADAGAPRGGYWELEPKHSYLALPELSCAIAPGGTVVVGVDMGIDHDCQHGGPVVVDEPPEGERTFTVRAHVWNHRLAEPSEEPCLGVAALAERYVPVHIPERFAGQTVRIRDALTDSVVEVSVLEEAPFCDFEVGEGDACQTDCQCEGDLTCVPGLGDGVMCIGGTCERVCQPRGWDGEALAVEHPGRDCPPGYACEPARAHTSAICGRIASDICGEPADCPEGMECPVTDAWRECRWTLTPSVLEPRTSCREDTDCAPGLRCVENVGGGRTCEIPCFSTTMRCPEGTACQPMARLSGARWVCETWAF